MPMAKERIHPRGPRHFLGCGVAFWVFVFVGVCLSKLVADSGAHPLFYFLIFIFSFSKRKWSLYDDPKE
jgi:hypothetical protein